MSEMAEKYKNVALHRLYGNNCMGDLVLIKFETLWDTNHGSVNGIGVLRGIGKNLGPCSRLTGGITYSKK